MIGMADDTSDRMEDCGVANHEGIGRIFCDRLGFPETVGILVQGHVQAKRYLCWRHPSYATKLSDASKTTLRHQGGAMEEEEAVAFEKNPHFTTIINMRSWDEAAKVPGMKVPSLREWEPTIRSLLQSGSTTSAATTATTATTATVAAASSRGTASPAGIPPAESSAARGDEPDQAPHGSM